MVLSWEYRAHYPELQYILIECKEYLRGSLSPKGDRTSFHDIITTALYQTAKISLTERISSIIIDTLFLLSALKFF